MNEKRSDRDPAAQQRVERRKGGSRRSEPSWKVLVRELGHFTREKAAFGIAGGLTIGMVAAGVSMSAASAAPYDYSKVASLASASIVNPNSALDPMVTETSRSQGMRASLGSLPMPDLDPFDIKLLDECPSDGPQPSGPNGHMPDSALCEYRNIKLRADAAEALARMHQAFVNEFGRNMCLGNGYRSYAQQASMHRSRPGMVAAPGKSNHGLGLAIDFCGTEKQRGSAQYSWMLKNAGKYGWILPDWAKPGGGKPEPWHWEFKGNGRIS